jgi:hypothetical protein
MKKSNFDIAMFETLELNSLNVKSGYSAVYSGGGLDNMILNAKNNGCTNTCNTVKGCACTIIVKK